MDNTSKRGLKRRAVADPLDVSDGRYRAWVFEVVRQHGHQMVCGARNPLQLNIWFHQVSQGLCARYPLLQQMFFTAYSHQARQRLVDTNIKYRYLQLLQYCNNFNNVNDTQTTVCVHSSLTKEQCNEMHAMH